MKDFNFFSPYLEEKRYLKSRITYYGSVIGIIILFTIAFYTWSYVKVSSLNKEIKNAELFLKSSETVKQINNIEEIKSKITILEKYLSIVQSINNNLDNNNVINSNLLEIISQSVPLNVHFNSISIDVNILQIQGIGESRIAIAEFIHNLKETEVFSTVHVLNINNEYNSDNLYNFTLKCTLKGVKTSEINE